MNFTDRELKLINQLKRLPVDFKSRLNLWAVEIIPPIIFIGAGLYTDKSLYLIIAICILMFFNIIRLWRQHSSVRVLKSIATKLEKHIS
jgi:hypothetical protein